MRFGKTLSIVALFVLISCNSGSNRKNINISGIDIQDIKIKRYGKALFTIDTTNLKSGLEKIQADFPVFLDGDLDDPYSLNMIRGFLSDTILINLYADCETAYPNLSVIEKQLETAFKHYRYYFPESVLPAVYSYISGYDYEHKVQFYNNNLLIALDLYLGKDYPTYKQLGLSQYVYNKFDKQYLLRDCMIELSAAYINPRNVNNTLLDFIINEGKVLWFTKAMIPNLSNQILMGYTKEQNEWASANEAMIWAFLIENELLYSTDPMTKQKFIKDGPFTSFFGNDSPPRLGVWMGYLIIDKLMENNSKITLPELMNNYDSQKILKRSGYKPKL